MNVNEGIEGVIGGSPCIGEIGGGGAYPFTGPGNDIGPGPARDPVDEPEFPFVVPFPILIVGAVAPRPRGPLGPFVPAAVVLVVVDNPAAEKEVDGL